MTTLPTDSKSRKDIPLVRGLLDYFPNALAAVAEVSRVGNDQHNPGEEMHWAFDKSTDEPDCILRHLVDRGTFDVDGVRHSAKVGWRALALLERELIAGGATPGRAVKMTPKVRMMICEVWPNAETHPYNEDCDVAPRCTEVTQ